MGRGGTELNQQRGLGPAFSKRALRFVIPILATVWSGVLLVLYFALGSDFALMLLTPLFPLGMGGLLPGIIGIIINWAMWVVVFSALRAGLRSSRQYWS